MSKMRLKPGLISGYYPQQPDIWPDALETMLRGMAARLAFCGRRREFTTSYIVAQVSRYEQDLSRLSESALQIQASQIRSNLQRYGLQKAFIFESFALIREVAARLLNQRPYDVQLLAAWAMINGMVVEMATGEGKTLSAALTSCTAALAGIPVHVVTANDYLAGRDQQLLKPLYDWLGLSSASVVEGMEEELRVQAYDAQIVHSTAAQIAFDYLRDRLQMGSDTGKMQIQFHYLRHQQQRKPRPLLLRGLCFAIIDEADNLLVDEAKTPLIISKFQDHTEQDSVYYDALYLASSLSKGNDFACNMQTQEIFLTPAGKNHLKDLTQSLDKLWQQQRYAEFIVTLALKAKYLFQRDKHYLVRDGKVVIIDELTGRMMPDRSWEQGLHQLMEAKEGCEISSENDPIARISFQKFFKRYLRLAGMSGTISEVGAELQNVYGLQMVKIPPHKPSRRIVYPERLYKNADAKWQYLIERVNVLHQSGRPILIGTPTVNASERVSELLTQHALPHEVLNAHQDQQEAQIIAAAGQAGAITVATNMAGRGTDIALGNGMAALGGLHVIMVTRNDARRIDRQLYGRCARQGDPGSCEGIMSLTDENIVNFYPAAMLKRLAGSGNPVDPLTPWLARLLLWLPQQWTERKHARMRKFLIKQEQQQAKTLAFTGRME